MSLVCVMIPYGNRPEHDHRPTGRDDAAVLFQPELQVPRKLAIRRYGVGVRDRAYDVPSSPHEPASGPTGGPEPHGLYVWVKVAVRRGEVDQTGLDALAGG